MLRTLCTIIVIVFLGRPSQGQAQFPSGSSGITLESKPPTTAVILSRLDSGDPQLVAWGAHFARESCNAAAAGRLLELAEGWTWPDMAKDTTGREKVDAMSEVLDALIKCNWKVSPKALAAIDSSFPGQTAILASRQPTSEILPLLQDWYGRRASSAYLGALPRFAAMRLASEPPPGFVASILAESKESLEVSVRADAGTGSHDSLRGVAMCADSFGVPARPGWPPLYRYDVVSRWPLADGPTIAQLADEKLFYTRSPLSKGWGSCSGPPGVIDDYVRLDLIAGMLGVDKREMQWQPQKSISIPWANERQYLAELRAQIAFEEKALQSTVDVLHKRGLLTDAEMESVRPELSITVFDDRGSAHPRLPLPKIRDPHTTINLGYEN
jgi:hypothetical protein